MLSAKYKLKRTAAALRGFLATARLSCFRVLPRSPYNFGYVVFFMRSFELLQVSWAELLVYAALALDRSKIKHLQNICKNVLEAVTCKIKHKKTFLQMFLAC